MNYVDPMDTLNLTFHHFGLAVKQPDYAISFLTALGYRIGATVFDPGQNVRLIMCHHATQPAVEIIFPGDGPGPVDALVQRNASGIIYHSCYETPDLARTLEILTTAGIQADCVSPPKPAPLFDGRKVSFYRVKGMGLIEILE